MVLQEDAIALVVNVAMMLKLDGYDPVITAANQDRLMQLGMEMLDAFGAVSGPTTEDNDG